MNEIKIVELELDTMRTPDAEVNVIPGVGLGCLGLGAGCGGLGAGCAGAGLVCAGGGVVCGVLC